LVPALSVICCPPAVGMVSVALNRTRVALVPERFEMVKIMFRLAAAGPACTCDWLKVLV